MTAILVCRCMTAVFARTCAYMVSVDAYGRQYVCLSLSVCGCVCALQLS